MSDVVRLLLCTIAVLAAPVRGFAACASDGGEAAPAEPTGIAELVVTATRQASPLSAVPESVTAFTRDRMEQLGVKSMADLARFTPGVTFDPDRHDVSIRGIISKAGSGTTGIYIDDTTVQMRALGLNANNTLPAVFDLDRVEVLRGPQGALFGAGSEGGTVRYITPEPSLTTYSTYLHAEAATTQGGGLSYETGAAIGGPLVQDRLGLRLSAWGRRDGGYISRVDDTDLAATSADANRVDTYVLRAAINWAPDAETSLIPAIYYQKRDQHNYDNYWVSISTPSAQRFWTGTPDRMADPDGFSLVSLKGERQVGDFTFISNSAYYRRQERVNGYSGTLYNLSYFEQLTMAGVDPMGNACPACTSAHLLSPKGPNLPGFGRYVASNLITNTQENYTQEFRLQTKDPKARLTWVTGVFYANNTQQSTEEIRDPQLNAISQYLWGEDILTAWGEPLLSNGDDYINHTRAHDRQLAAFAEGGYRITDRLRLTAGVRLAETHFDFRNFADGPQELAGAPVTSRGAKNETPVTPKFGLVYEIAPANMIYATVAKGYRIGGATPPLPQAACGGAFPTSYNSDSVMSYEVGAKDRFAEQRLQISASAYYIRWSNIQQAIYIPACGLQTTANVGDAVSRGFDLQGQWQPSRALQIGLAVGLTDARFSRTALDALGAVLAQKGDSLDVVPWTVALDAQYSFALWGREAYLRTDWTFNSRRTTPVPAEDPATRYYDPGLVPNPATNQVSVRAGRQVGKAELTLYADNVLNAHPQLDLQHQDKSTLLYEAETFRPRTLGVALGYRY